MKMALPFMQPICSPEKIISWPIDENILTTEHYTESVWPLTEADMTAGVAALNNMPRPLLEKRKCQSIPQLMFDRTTVNKKKAEAALQWKSAPIYRTTKSHFKTFPKKHETEAFPHNEQTTLTVIENKESFVILISRGKYYKLVLIQGQKTI